MITNDERYETALDIEPTNQARRMRLARTMLIDAAIDGRSAAIRYPAKPRKPTRREAGARARKGTT